MKDFRDLEVWSYAHEVTLETYRLTKIFPDDERFGLVVQMRRCAASVPSNIAEGCGRRTDADFARFLHIAMGSASELDYQLLLAVDLNYVDRATAEVLRRRLERVKRMLTGLLRRLNRSAS